MADRAYAQRWRCLAAGGVGAMLFPEIRMSKFNTKVCVFFVTRTVYLCVLQTRSGMMSCAAAAWLTDSFRTTTWGPMVCLSRRLTAE